MKEERTKFIDVLNRNALCLKERKQAEKVIKDSDIKAHGKTIPFSYIPLILCQKDVKILENIINEADCVLSKVTRRYIENQNYRKLFGFSKDMEKLILLPCNYDTVIPVGRYDVFYNEETGEYEFCEFNTDGSGGMSRDYEMSTAILDSFCDQEFVKKNKLRIFPVIETIAKELIKIYYSDKNAVEHPVFCVTDFKEEGVFSDFERFIKEFKRLGVDARFTDIRDLKFDGQNLFDRTDGTVINGIYRRAVTSVVLEHMEECQGLIDALEAQRVVLLGHFRTSVVHSKMIHAVLHHEETLKILNDGEKNWVKTHIPFTRILEKDEMSEELLNEIYSDKDNWVLKPMEGFASHGVVCGMDVSLEEWKSFIEEYSGKNYLIQKFCKRYEVPVLETSAEEITDMSMMLGIYCTGGHFAGCYSRAGNGGTIDFDHGGLCVSTLVSG